MPIENPSCRRAAGLAPAVFAPLKTAGASPAARRSFGVLQLSIRIKQSHIQRAFRLRADFDAVRACGELDIGARRVGPVIAQLARVHDLAVELHLDFRSSAEL